jgi:hypothetical protein
VIDFHEPSIHRIFGGVDHSAVGHGQNLRTHRRGEVGPGVHLLGEQHRMCSFAERRRHRHFDRKWISHLESDRQSEAPVDQNIRLIAPICREKRPKLCIFDIVRTAGGTRALERKFHMRNIDDRRRHRRLVAAEPRFQFRDSFEKQRFSFFRVLSARRQRCADRQERSPPTGSKLDV